MPLGPAQGVVEVTSQAQPIDETRQAVMLGQVGELRVGFLKGCDIGEHNNEVDYLACIVLNSSDASPCRQAFTIAAPDPEFAFPITTRVE